MNIHFLCLLLFELLQDENFTSERKSSDLFLYQFQIHVSPTHLYSWRDYTSYFYAHSSAKSMNHILVPSIFDVTIKTNCVINKYVTKNDNQFSPPPPPHCTFSFTKSIGIRYCVSCDTTHKIPSVEMLNHYKSKLVFVVNFANETFILQSIIEVSHSFWPEKPLNILKS